VSKAVVFSQYGGPDVLHVMTVPPASPGPGLVRVSVKAAGVQPFDSLFRSGAAHQWMPAVFPQRLGNEFAGIVDMVGEGVEEVGVGDQVFGWAMLASYAEHVLVPTSDIVSKPDGLPWPDAGVLPASGQTAMTALDLLGVGEGDTVLIHAAAGGVGSFAVQIARAAGATVIGTASQRNHEYLQALGAIPVAYGDGLADRVRALTSRITAALDASGTIEALRASVELVDDRQRTGTVAFQPAADALGVRRLGTQRSADRLRRLADLYNRTQLTVEIQQTYPLEHAAHAHHAIDTGHVRGKLALTV
jgi:enoyl reductase